MDWIQYIKTDENQALKEIYTRYKKACVTWLISKYNCDPEEALDIFQLSIVILYDNVVNQKLTELSHDLKFYLNGIAKNKAHELIRKRKPTVPLADNSVTFQYINESIEHEELEEKEDRLKAAVSALDELGEPCKSLLELYYYNDMSMEEICHKLDYKNADSVKSQKYKCLKRLQIIYFDHINIKKIEK